MSTAAPASAVAPATLPAPARVLSIDILRGFDMFWLIGGHHLVKALTAMDAGPVVAAVATQLTHVTWEGLRFYDVVFPLFLVLVGVSIVFSIDRLRATTGRGAILGRIARRSALLYVAGVFYYGGVSSSWATVQYAGVLPRIAACYLVGATLYLLLPRRAIVVTAFLCLFGYWGLFTFVPVPDFRLDKPTVSQLSKAAGSDVPAVIAASVPGMVRGSYEEGRNLTHYVDFRFLPGRKRNTYYTNEGLLSTIPAVASTLFGLMAGWVLTDARRSERRKVLTLLAGGVAAIALGLLVSLEVPIIKRLWTASFCLVSTGCSVVLIALFHQIVDGWGWRKWGTPFLWIGSNALTAYLLVELVGFEAIARRLVGGGVQAWLDATFTRGAGALTISLMALLLPLLLLRFLHQRRIFLRL